MALRETIEPAERPSGKRRGRPAQGAPRQAAQVQSLSRALTLLERASEREHGASLSELAAAVGLAPSTAHRLLRSMERMGFVRQDEERGLWFVGVKAFVIGGAFARSRDIVAIARPFMHDLMEEVQESVNLAVLDQDEPVYLSQVECRRMIRAHALPGARAPAHCSGVGKALLAELPWRRVEAALKRRGLPRLTPRTITAVGAFRAELERVRRAGYALDDEEQNPGMRCIAAVIHDENGEAVAAVSMTGPSARIAVDRLQPLGEVVKTAARRISGAIGGRPPAGPRPE